VAYPQPKEFSHRGTENAEKSYSHKKAQKTQKREDVFARRHEEHKEEKNKKI
jgi:hypothetical protein